jgi:hypothetical protein
MSQAKDMPSNDTDIAMPRSKAAVENWRMETSIGHGQSSDMAFGHVIRCHDDRMRLALDFYEKQEPATSPQDEDA